MKIKIIQYDGGGEFDVLNFVLASYEVFKHVSCLLSLNKMVCSRENIETLLRKVFHYLHRVIYTLYFGMKAFCSRFYLINRLPTLILSQNSPLELLFPLTPNYTFLHAFGCLCSPHIKPYNSNKLEFCSLPYVFIGYSPSEKDYKCLGQFGKLFVSRHVIFDEHSYPSCFFFITNSYKFGCQNFSSCSSKIFRVIRVSLFTSIWAFNIQFFCSFAVVLFFI